MRTKLRSKVTLLFMMCAVLLAIPAVALADNTISDGDDLAPIADSDMALGSVCSGVESSKAAPVFINRNGAASATNVNSNVFANSSTATVTITGVTGAGLSAEMGTPNTITLPSNWDSQANNTKSASVSSTVKLNSSVAGPGTGSVTYTATGTNAAGGTVTRTDTMNVSWTTANCDTTAPTVSSINTANATPTNAASVSWTVTFSESVTGVDSSDFALANNGLTGPSVTGVTGSGTTYTVTANTGTGDGTLGLNLVDNDSIADGASNKLDGSFTGQVYTIDKTKPVISASATLPGGADYTAGTWTNEDVQVSFSCTDNTGGSGINTNTVAGATKTASGANQSVTNTGTCTDNAGNTALPATFSDIDIDKDAPTDVVGTLARATDHNGWYNTPINATFAGQDTLSGIASCSSDGAYSGPDGTDKTVTGSCTDNAGNSANGSSPAFKFDDTNPNVSGTLARATDHNGWYNAPVGYSFGGTDATSGINTSSCTAGGTYSGPDGTGLSVSGSCSDNAGNSASGSTPVFKFDDTNPTDVRFIGGPDAGGSYDFGPGNVPAAPTCDADDATSQLQSPNGCVVSGYSAAAGSHTMTATATDNAGNVATATRSYTVFAAKGSGFYQPVDMGGVLNTVKSGSTVPVKFELFGGFSNIEQKTTDAVGSITARKVNCGAFTGAPTDTIEYLAPTSENTGLRFDTTGDQFIYNWKTPARAANTCYSLTMTAADGQTTLVAYFQLK
jgi:hypothetical protein